MPARSMMSDAAGRVLEGVFAIKKPPSISSAQVLRDLQHAFKSSETFAPLLEQTLYQERKNQHRGKRRRLDDDNVFKMGHGGTLDPMATGVLIVGIGRGTKHLQSFLGCTKTYETVVLFGKSTDTYDVAGKIVATADTSKINRAVVESKLSQFTGSIKQMPPIYSALKINGMKAYEYARTGKALPKELEARDMTVNECVLTEWYDRGQHDYRWPAEEAPQEEKDMLISLAEHPSNKSEPVSASSLGTNTQALELEKPVENTEVQEQKSSKSHANPVQQVKANLHTHELSGLESEPAEAPAARIRLAVSSGFYVRSFAHDLGVACGSYGTMAELARTQQATYTVTDPPPAGMTPAIDHADLARGEDIWGPRIQKVLEAWLANNPAATEQRYVYDRPRNRDARGHKDKSRHRDDWRKRRNSSSPD